MAYVKAIEPQRCGKDGCTSCATHVLMTKWDVPLRSYCQQHAREACATLNVIENETSRYIGRTAVTRGNAL